MKRGILFLLVLLILTGCSSATWETLGDIPHQDVAAPAMQQILLTLPEDSAEAVWSGENEKMYLCEDYSIHIQTLDGGNIASSVQELSGFLPKNLTIVESRCGNHQRYEFVWTAAAEEGDLISRCALLDDGNYHYALTVTAAAADAGNLQSQWNELMRSFCLEAGD